MSKGLNLTKPQSLLTYLSLKCALVAVFIAWGSHLQAQLCNGSFGDPVVNLTFGSSSGANAFVPAASYTYTSSYCPDDGFYTVTKGTSDCFGNTWHTLTSDHTGGGAFMLVNASFTPGDFFVTTVSDLCPNTTYEFAAWIMNVMKLFNSILPNLTFRVETPGGVVLTSFNTGDIPVTRSPEWNQYGFIFTTPIDNPVIVLRITNNAPGGMGNDLALDDITFRPCGSKISASITGLVSDTVNLCEGDNAVAKYDFSTVLSSAYVLPLYQWQESVDKGTTWHDISGAGGLSYETPVLTNPGNYWYRFTVVEASVAKISSCKIASDALMINIHPKPVVSAGSDKIALNGYPVQLTGKAEGEQVTYSWSPDQYLNSAGMLNPGVSAPSDMTYVLSARSEWGCANTDTVNVKVVAGIYVPNVFTPNGDGTNDRWEVPFLDPSFGGEVSVFNRWGQRVYHIDSARVSWDGNFRGEPQRGDVYTYYIRIPKYDLLLKGTFHLIR